MKFQGGEHHAPGGRAFLGATRPCRATVLVTPDTLEKGGLAPLDAMVFVTKEPGAEHRRRPRARSRGSSRTCRP